MICVLLDTELVLELHVFAAIYQPMAVLKNKGRKRELFPLRFDRPSLVSEATVFRGEM